MKRFYSLDGGKNEESIAAAIAAIAEGGIIAHATDTVYGLCTRWDSSPALERLTTLKQRIPDKPYSLMVRSPREIMRLSALNDPRVDELLSAIFPGAVTLLLPNKRRHITPFWNQFPYLGFRIPGDDVSALLLAASTIPLVTTSANISAEPPPARVQDISQSIRDGVDVLLDSGDCELGRPSTIIRLEPDAGRVAVVREGAYPVEKFLAHFKRIW